jgi:hypothetical protein
MVKKIKTKFIPKFATPIVYQQPQLIQTTQLPIRRRSEDMSAMIRDDGFIFGSSPFGSGSFFGSSPFFPRKRR